MELTKKKIIHSSNNTGTQSIHEQQQQQQKCQKLLQNPLFANAILKEKWSIRRKPTEEQKGMVKNKTMELGETGCLHLYTWLIVGGKKWNGSYDVYFSQFGGFNEHGYGIFQGLIEILEYADGFSFILQSNE